ncbi:MAG: HsdR family type I site-specific deoxyribonuclease [Bacillota bacterium]
MGKFGGEKYSVQVPILGYVQEPTAEYVASDGTKVFLNLGWDYIPPEEALRLRGGETGFILKDTFVDQMQRLNPDFMDNLLAEELIKKLSTVLPNIEGNLTVWKYLKGIGTVFVPNEKRERNVTFIDTENIHRNTFHVTDEFQFTNRTQTIRPDIVFFINGIPVLFVETKAAHKTEAMSEALEQIKRYHRECPELLAVMQVYALTDILDYYYSGTWNTSGKFLFKWKNELKGDFETQVKTFLDRETCIRLLVDFTMFARQDDELKKIVLRPHQMRAVTKVIERAGDKEKKRGLIWHTQGSGKTYTMIVAAQKIIHDPIFQNPTVIMLVDRNELESQLFGNISALGIERVEVAESKKHLEALLKQDKRGLIVSMIHKFENMPENTNLRENIFVLIDEAHRTTTGKLGNYLMGALPNATYIGFTGTPIDKTQYGKGTFVQFGTDDPPQGYLDKYSIAESIQDGTTVPLYYTLAPSELQIDKEILEREFLQLAEVEGVSDIEELNKVLERAVTLRSVLKNKERVEKVAKFVADHYREFVEPMGYKAFLVAVDREGCALYKEELDKHLPAEYSEVVYSPFYNDPDHLAKYHLSETEEKRIRKAFRRADETPKILIVTEKLLTGFDAPILYCMYLDKPMRDHVLLQAIARVNRPYEDDQGRKKSAGLVVDFVGIFDNLEKALAFDSQDIAGIVRDIEVLRERFTDEMKVAKGKYLSLIEGKERDKAVEAVLEYFFDEEERQEFYKFFRQLSDMYEIISPDPFLSPYLDDYETLSRMFRTVRENYERKIPVDKDFLRKTAALVREHTESGPIGPTLEVVEINEELLRKIEESGVSDIEKIYNLIRIIEITAEKEGETAPYLTSIAAKAEAVVRQYENRQKTTAETLEQIKEIITEINAAKAEQSEKGMSEQVFTVYWMLKEAGFQDAEGMANQLAEVFERYPHWQKDPRQDQEVRKLLYKAIFHSGETDAKTVTELVKNIMCTIKGGGGS